MPGGPPQGMPQPGGAPGGQPPMGRQNLDWRQLVQAVQQSNPNIKPDVLAEAVNQFLPMMSQQSQQEWRQVSLQIREQQLQQREQQFLMADATKRGEGAANRGSREGIAANNRVSRETIAKMTVDERREAHEAGLISKEQMDEANRGSREKIAGENRESRERVSGANREQKEKQFQQRENRLQESLKLREDSTWARLEQQKQQALQKAEAADGKAGLAQVRAIMDQQDKHIRTRIQAYSVNNNLKPAERKALLDQADADYDAQIKDLKGKFSPTNSGAPQPRAAPAQTDMPPPEAVQALKEGQVTTFENGQKWTLKGGKPERVP